MAVSTPEELTEGTFREIIPAEADPASAERLVFCSGKVYFDLVQALQADESVQGKVALTRIEQFYPFPKEAVRAELERYREAKDVLWVQEEPANMGAWNFLRYRLDALLEDVAGDCSHRVRYVGRPSSASTATGSAAVHQMEQEFLLTEALSL
jgi:2-oxoglutarate dehydrogenase E1 component